MNARTRRTLVLAGMGLLALSAPAAAVEFAIVGPRAVGMGGAGVAVTDDALATYWNPAGLAMQKTVDVQIQGSAQFIDRMGIKDTVDEVDSLARSYSTLAEAQANAPRLKALVDRLNQPSTSVSGIGSAGLYFKGYYGDHAFGFNVSDVATGGMFLPSPVTCTSPGGVGGCTSGGGTSLSVNGSFALRGLEARQVGFSYAYAFADRKLAVGATAKIIQGAAYSSSVAVQGSDAGSSFTSDIGKATISTTYGIDVGAIYRPTSWLRMGVVGKDLNQPTFDAPGGGEFKLNPQARGGVAVNPYESLTVSFDGDITSNKTFVPGIKSRVLSLGAEQKIFDVVALRAGALKNVEDANSYITPTAGLGVRLWALHLDVGGGYDFRQRGALVSGALGLTF
jgi:F plasmid transfer operon, TraF, protein